jgi:hypothetical protein
MPNIMKIHNFSEGIMGRSTNTVLGVTDVCVLTNYIHCNNTVEQNFTSMVRDIIALTK